MSKRIITSPDAPTTGLTDKARRSPLAPAIRAGDLPFVSGQGPLDPKTREVVSADIRDQVRQTPSNIIDNSARIRINAKFVWRLPAQLRRIQQREPLRRWHGGHC